MAKVLIFLDSYTRWVSSDVDAKQNQTGEKGDAIYDAFYASQVQFQNDQVRMMPWNQSILPSFADLILNSSLLTVLTRHQALAQNISQRAGAALLDRIGPAIIMSHSHGGALGFLIADARPSLVPALISLEPLGPPFEDILIMNNTAARPYGLTTIPITYDPPVVNPAVDLPRVTIPPPANGNLSACILQASPPKKLSKLVDVAQLVVTTEASYHAVYDYCTVLYLRQAGVDVEFLNLPLAGIRGNAHFLFMEKNNLEIAEKVEGWIRSKVKT